MKRVNYGTCQIEGCDRPARFGLFHTQGKIKTWKYVCEQCESRIGHENLLRARRNRRCVLAERRTKYI